MEFFVVTLYVEVIAMGGWAVTTAVAGPFTGFADQRLRVSGLERCLARLPRWLTFLGGMQAKPTTLRTPMWSRLEAAHGSSTRTLDAAQDALFALPMLFGWLLGIAIVPLLVGASLAGQDLVFWTFPMFYVAFNVAALLTTLVARRWAWSKRAPFAWRVVRAVEIHHGLVAGAAAKGAAAVAEQVDASSRAIEGVLRGRFGRGPKVASDAAAAAGWDEQLRPLIEARMNRVLSLNRDGSAGWFDAWVELAAGLVMTAAPTSLSDALKGDRLPRHQEPTVPLWGLWAAPFVIAALGFFLGSGNTTAVSDGVKTAGAIVTIVVGALSSANLLTQLARSRRDDR